MKYNHNTLSSTPNISDDQINDPNMDSYLMENYLASISGSLTLDFDSDNDCFNKDVSAPSTDTDSIDNSNNGHSPFSFPGYFSSPLFNFSRSNSNSSSTSEDFSASSPTTSVSSETSSSSSSSSPPSSPSSSSTSSSPLPSGSKKKVSKPRLKKLQENGKLGEILKATKLPENSRPKINSLLNNFLGFVRSKWGNMNCEIPVVLELIRFVKAQPIFVSTETTSTGRYARDLQTAQASQELHLLKMMASILKAMLFGCSSSDSSGFRGNVVSYTRSFGCFLAASRGRPITHLSKTTLEKLARLFLAMATHYMKDKDEVPAQIATKGLDLTLEYFAQRNEFTEVSQMLIDTDIDVDNDNDDNYSNDNDDNYSNDNEDDDDDIDDSNSSFNSVVLNLLFRNYNLNNQQFFNNRNH